MYECFHCCTKSVIWDSDFNFEDFGYEGEGIIHICHCTNCGAQIEYKIPIPNESEDKMDNVIHEPCWWYFTFGGGQKHAGHYVKFFGTWMTTRQQMFDKYGRNWAFQYSEEEWEAMQDNPWLEKELIEDSGD